MAATSNDYFGESKLLSVLISYRKIMAFKSYWTFACLILSVSQCFADEDHEMEEFLKREYSLSKPYQGNDPLYTPQLTEAGG